MDKLVAEVSALFNTTSKTDQKLCTGAVGMTIYTLFFTAFVSGILKIIELAKSASSVSQEVLAFLCFFMIFAAVLIYLYYLIKYGTLFFVTLFHYGVKPRFKDSEKSIESIMTSEVDDKKRLHKSILGYLNEYPAPRNFAALFIWLNDKQLLVPLEQARFLDVLKTDFIDSSSSATNKKDVSVPSTSSFSEAKVKLEKDDKKEYLEGCFDRIFEKRFRRFLKDVD